MDKAALRAHFDAMAPDRDRWKARNGFYYAHQTAHVLDLVAPGQRVLEIGCGTGDLLHACRPRVGLGLDLSPAMVGIAAAKYPDLQFVVGDAEALPLQGPFDVVLISDLVGHLTDILEAFECLHQVVGPDTIVVVTYYNYLWEPVLEIGEQLGVKMPQNLQNWVSFADLQNFLTLGGFQVTHTGLHVLLPVNVPLLAPFCNRVLARLPYVRGLDLLEVVVARAMPERPPPAEPSVSIIIPCKDEAGNIPGAVERTPLFGSKQELIFVDGESRDGTVEAIEAQIALHPEREIRLLHQIPADGKKGGTWMGFDAARYDVLMVLDSDLTVPPEDLPKFYRALAEDHADFINGSRLVYQMEPGAMRILNIIANKAFSLAFTWLLDQRITDTLCGTKVLRKVDYERIMANQAYFGDFDPFGDFDLLFGAAHLGMRIVDLPVRYKARVYGDIKIDRWRHGWMLLKMTVVAFRKLKLPRLLGRAPAASVD